MIKRLFYFILLQAMLLNCLLATVSDASDGGFEVQAIEISPAETVTGAYPEISGRIKMIKADVPGGDQITVIAVLYRPDKVMKSWVWKNIRLHSGGARIFTIPKEYELKQAGSYRVDYNVYSHDMRPLHRLSRSFVAVDPASQSSGTKKDKTYSETFSHGRASKPAEEQKYLGLGVYGNAVNAAGGGTILFWPFKYVGLQANYMAGAFTSFERRLLLRFPLSSGISPYLGGGYIDAFKDEEIIGVKTRFRDSGPTGVIGVEIPVSSSLRGYLEITGASMKFEKVITNKGLSVKATVDYFPVGFGAGLVYFFF